MNDNRLTFFLHPIVLMMTLSAALPAVSVALLLQQSFTVVLSVGLAAALFGLLWGTLTYNLSYGRLDRMLSAYIDTLAKVAEGDLTMQINMPPLSLSTREGAITSRLVQVTNQMIERLRGVVADFYSAFQRLETDTQAILEATARQINMANEQDAVVTETTATVNEVRATVTETAERAQSVAETANLSVTISRGGIEAVAETIEGMDLIRRRVEDIADNILVLSEHTQQIGEIISTVNALADQSRMLALNASVEAARAGEEGKGFAVVAMEVRNLADQNRDATVQVREILGEIQRATNSAVMVTEEGSKGVDNGQMLVNKAGESIRELSKAIEEAALAAMQIAASTRQQTIGMDQLTGAMRTIKHATTETVSSTMMVEASVQRLREAATRVNSVLQGLKY
ncbi:methyl-accepting chemotaxis protein [Aggregatilineales bacterium SYSU G02658]